MATLGLPFEIVVSDYDEQLDDSRSLEDVAKELGLGKALDVAAKRPKAWVIGSDTIVSLGGQQLGKQPDIETARQLLRRMSGQRVDVITSVALVCKELGAQEVRAAKSAIIYAPYGEDAIERWLASNEWQDKAGATGVQSPHTPPVDHIEGDYDTVLGLNMRLVAAMLSENGVNVAIPVVQPLQ